jgi:hypothetical protein
MSGDVACCRARGGRARRLLHSAAATGHRPYRARHARPYLRLPPAEAIIVQPMGAALHRTGGRQPQHPSHDLYDELGRGVGV